MTEWHPIETAPKVTPTPLFSCRERWCRAEQTFPADMLRIWRGELVCQECFSNSKEYEGVWADLPPFVFAPLRPWADQICKAINEHTALKEEVENQTALKERFKSRTQELHMLIRELKEEVERLKAQLEAAESLMEFNDE